MDSSFAVSLALLLELELPEPSVEGGVSGASLGGPRCDGLGGHERSLLESSDESFEGGASEDSRELTGLAGMTIFRLSCRSARVSRWVRRFSERMA